MEIPSKLLEFAKNAYKNFDESHNLNHALNVYKNVVEITNNEILSVSFSDIYSKNYSIQDFEELMYITILHDVIDHKYVGIPIDELKEFLINELGVERGMRCLHVIQNMSWSKEKKGLNEPLKEKDWIRKFAQDADWLEAIGEVGLKRCIDYTREIGLPIPLNVCTHIKEKLLKIPTDLNTQTAKNKSQELIKPLIKYLEENDF